MDSLDRFSAFIEDEALFNANDRLLLAVSGGKDSILMAHLFQRSSYAFGIAHCNFQLRGSDADEDAAFVEAVAKSMGVPFYSVSFNTKDEAKRRQVSIQMAARDLRYAWLETVRVKENYDYIATAHHQTDSVETVLINLVRGTGIVGLQGILPKRDRIVRPLLAFSAAEVEALVREQNYCYREDQSNKERKYTRNKIRIEVLPVLREINPSLEATFSASSKRFSLLAAFLNSEIERLRDKLFIMKEPDVFHILVKDMEPYIHNLAVLFELFHPFSFSEAILSDLVESIRRPTSTGRYFYSPSHQMLIDRGKIVLRSIVEGSNEVQFINSMPIEFTWAEQHFRASFSEDVSIMDDENIAKIDAEGVSLPIRVRTWCAGDRFTPLGMKGQKKLSDFLIDQKIASDEKENIAIFVDSNEEILWVAPYRINDRYKLSEKTKKVIIFERL